MSAQHVAYWDYDAEAQLSCPACGWAGPGGTGEPRAELFDVRCGDCDQMLLIVSFPTPEETAAAAAAGNAEAAKELRGDG